MPCWVNIWVECLHDFGSFPADHLYVWGESLCTKTSTKRCSKLENIWGIMSYDYEGPVGNESCASYPTLHDAKSQVFQVYGYLISLTNSKYRPSLNDSIFFLIVDR